jgi:dTDP-4-dehydrorhamnose reductase
MRILLLGNTGQLGWELERTLAPLGDVTPVDFPALNLADPQGTRHLVRRAAPQVIVNATAYTLVDKAESEPDKALCYAINAAGLGILAEEAKALGAALIHVSTDYVFPGKDPSTLSQVGGGLGWGYVETDATGPLNAYGASKLAGEQAVAAVDGAYLTFRTAWVYTTRRDSFVTKTLQWARQQTTLKIVSDQISNPTSARMLAETLALVLAQAGRDPVGWIGERGGLYHLAGDGYASRLEWAKEILRLDPRKEEQTVQEILPAQTRDFPTPAARPLFSALDCSKFQQTFGLQLPDWRYALKLVMG